MVCIVKISKRGTITIPVRMRKLLKLKPGQKIYQSIDSQNRVVIEFDKVSTKRDDQ